VSDEVTRTRQVVAAHTIDRRPYLDVLAGTARSRVALDRDAIVVGRSRSADVRLDVDGVSRKHARVVRSGMCAVSLIDLGAKNGTFVNGERIDIAALHHGDRIQIGPVVLEFLLLAEASAVSTTSAFGEQPSVRSALSDREWEVALHVARGLTNVEVAAALGISRRTVATHLERIYERLQIHSRAALASLVGHDAAG
jgi:DNA-binding CsgD family transcriptional regulator